MLLSLPYLPISDDHCAIYQLLVVLWSKEWDCVFFSAKFELFSLLAYARMVLRVLRVKLYFRFSCEDCKADADSIKFSSANHCHYHRSILRKVSRGCNDRKQGHLREIQNWRFVHLFVNVLSHWRYKAQTVKWPFNRNVSKQLSLLNYLAVYAKCSGIGLQNVQILSLNFGSIIFWF